jgi:cytochrome P450
MNVTVTSNNLAELVRIEEPEFYSDDPFPIFARMRAEQPVFWYEPLQTWVLTKYEDIRYVGKTPEIFSSVDGILLNDIRYGGVTNSFFGEKAELVSTTDPPRHRELRRVVAPSFTARQVRRWEDSFREYARELIESIVPGEPFDFVHAIGAVLPLKAIALVLGIPGDNLAELKYWSDEVLKMGAALDAEGLATAAANTDDMRKYLDEWMVRKLGDQSNELIPTMLNAKLAGESLGYDNLHMFLRAVLVAGNETTRDYLAGSLFAYAQYPGQRARLVADPSLAVQAGEECLRWTTPVRGMIRTVTQDTEIRGQAIKAGQHVHLMWMAANRDEDVWQRADSFDIGRSPDPMHLAFGFGEHLCIGKAVARLEGQVFFSELVQKYSRWEICGEPKRPNSVLHNSFEELPVTFYPA